MDVDYDPFTIIILQQVLTSSIVNTVASIRLHVAKDVGEQLSNHSGRSRSAPSDETLQLHTEVCYIAIYWFKKVFHVLNWFEISSPGYTYDRHYKWKET